METEKQTPLEETAKKKLSKGKKAWIIIGSIVVGLAVICAAVCAVAAGSQRILNNTSVMGVDMSGMNREQALKCWEERSKDVYKDTMISLTIDGKEEAQVSLKDLGVSVSPEEAVDAAWNVGREGNFVTNGYAFVRSYISGVNVLPPMSNVTAKQLKPGIKAMKKALNIPATNGKYRVDFDKQDVFYLTKCADGRALDTDKLREDLLAALQNGDLSPIACQTTPVAAKPLNLEKLHKKLAGAAKNASYDAVNDKIIEGKPGVKFDVEQAQQLMEQAQPGEEFEVPCEMVAPKVSKKDLEGHLFTDVLGTYTTYAGGSWARLMNVEKATNLINGAVLNSGEQFSYLDTLGPQTAATGWYPAPGYQGGKTVDMYGGGVCQVSSTLYYATLLANLKIVTRYCHQFAPSYITWGCDATVGDYPIDFVFENDRDYPIKIVASDVGNVITVQIIGTKVDDNYVEMVSETLGSTGYKVVEKKTDKLPAGTRQEEQSPYTGYYVKTWRYVYDGDGNLISSDLEAVSDYEARDQIILVGTKEAAKPDKKDDGKKDDKKSDEKKDDNKPKKEDTKPAEDTKPKQDTEPAADTGPATPETNAED